MSYGPGDVRVVVGLYRPCYPLVMNYENFIVIGVVVHV